MPIDPNLIAKRRPTTKPSKPPGESVSWWNKERSFGFQQQRFSDGRRQVLYHDLRVLLVAGLDLKSALELTAEGTGKKAVADIVLKIRDLIVSGASLYEAMKQCKVFSVYEVQSIRIGEASGRLPEVLLQLADFYDQRVRLRRIVTGALAYPAFVVVISLGAVFFMLAVIVPMFEDVFRQAGAELPSLTRSIMRVSDGFQANIAWILLGISALIGLYFLVRKQDSVRRVSSQILLKIPIAGSMIRRIHLSRFCSIMALLTSARVPMDQALALSGQMTSLYPLQKALPVIKQAVVNGKSLHEALREHRIFPRQLEHLARVGEASGTLPIMFEQLAQRYSEETEAQTAVLGNLLVPVVIVFVGGLVAVVLVALYLPMFEVGGVFG